MAKLGKELFKKMQAIQGHAYLSDAIEEMPDDRIRELVPIILEWQEEGVKVLREFLKAHLTPRAVEDATVRAFEKAHDHSYGYNSLCGLCNPHRN